MELNANILTVGMWKCHQAPPPPSHENGKRREASQKAIKNCDHLFPLRCLIHLSGEWFCPYPPKATNLFSGLYPCFKMNLWNTQIFLFFSSSLALSCLPSLSPVGSAFLFLVSFFLLLLFIHWISVGFFIFLFSPFLSSPPVLTFSPPSFYYIMSKMFLEVQSKIYPNKKVATTILCPCQFNPRRPKCMLCCACSGKLSVCI